MTVAASAAAIQLDHLVSDLGTNSSIDASHREWVVLSDSTDARSTLENSNSSSTKVQIGISIP